MNHDLFEDIICPNCKGAIIKNSESIMCDNCKSTFILWKNTLVMSSDHEFYYGEVPKNSMASLIDLCEKNGVTVGAHLALTMGLINKYSLEYTFSNRRASLKLLLGLSQDKVVLDFGCGMGIISLHLAPCFKKVYSADLTKERAEFTFLRAKQRGFNNVVPVCTGDGKSLPFKDKFFDCIILNGVLEWIAENKRGDVNEIQKNFLVEINRILKDNGHIYIGIENRCSYTYLNSPEDHTGLRLSSFLPRYLANIYSLIVRNKPYRTYTYSWNGYQGILKKAGFNVHKLFLPIGNYRFIKGFIDPENLKNNHIDTRNPNRKRAILKSIAYKILFSSILIKKIYPTFSIISKKAGKLAPFITEVVENICRNIVKNSPLEIREINVTSTETCIVSLCSKRRVDRDLIVKIPLNNLTQAGLNEESVFLSNMHDNCQNLMIVKYAPRFIHKSMLCGIEFFVYEKMLGKRSFSSINMKQKELLISLILDMSQKTKHNDRASSLLNAEYISSDMCRFMPSDKIEGINNLANVGMRFDDEFNNVRAMQHGDYWQGNVLWDNRRRLQGIIDWTDAQESDLPINDAFHFILYSLMVRGRVHTFGELCEAYVTNKVQLSPNDRKFIKEYCLGIYGDCSEKMIKRLVFLYSLRHFLKRIPFYIEILFDPIWIYDNHSYLTKALKYID